MTRLIFRSLKVFLLSGFTLFSFGCIAQDTSTATPPGILPIKATTYSVKPDYRKCAFPLCGGWFLTPVNQYSLQLEGSDEAYQHSLLVPNTIYVAHINYKQLGITPPQVQQLEVSMGQGQALLRGYIATNSVTAKTFVAQNAWTSPTTSEAVGTYLKVSSSGIICITTPCPYYKAELINTSYTSNFDELIFEKAELDRDQEALAWQAVATDGLVLTGTKYESKGQTGTGTGVSATKVFFTFPTKK